MNLRRRLTQESAAQVFETRCANARRCFPYSGIRLAHVQIALPGV